jgi:hypothetical protein
MPRPEGPEEGGANQTTLDFAAALETWKKRLFEDDEEEKEKKRKAEGAEYEDGERAEEALRAAKKTQEHPPTDDKLEKTAREFEAMVMTQMVQTLRKTVEPSGLFGSNQNERGIYEWLLDQSIFQKAAENGQTWGLAARLEESWKNHFSSEPVPMPSSLPGFETNQR